MVGRCTTLNWLHYTTISVNNLFTNKESTHTEGKVLSSLYSESSKLNSGVKNRRADSVDCQNFKSNNQTLQVINGKQC